MKMKINWSLIIGIILVLLIIGAIVGGIIFLSKLGIINSIVGLNKEKQTLLEDNPTGQCSLSLSKSTIEVGESVTGTISDGINSKCTIAIKKDSGEWELLANVVTDSNGIYSESQVVDIAGEYVFAVICANADGTWCRTNDKDLSVIDPSSCTDSDGNNKDVPGHVIADSIYYYDDCLDLGEVVTEYTCLSGDVVATNLACDLGEICVQTRSGGYCQAPPEGYEVGDNVGSGSSGFGSAGFGDDDSINVITMDWTTGGNYVLGAKITRSWDYALEDCYGPEQYPMEWTLYDSNGMAWQIYDYFPVDNAVDYVCPVTYHEDAPWKFVVSVGIQACPVEYGWNVQPYICEVLD